MKKSHIATLLIFLLVIPATLYFGLRLTGRAYFGHYRNHHPVPAGL